MRSPLPRRREVDSSLRAVHAARSKRFTSRDPVRFRPEATKPLQQSIIDARPSCCLNEAAARSKLISLEIPGTETVDELSPTMGGWPPRVAAHRQFRAVSNVGDRG